MRVLENLLGEKLGRLKNRRFFLIALFIFSSSIVSFGQEPDGYYSSADGKSGNDLKNALYLIINSHTALSYDQLWTAFQYTDKKSNGKVWDMYSDIPNGTPSYEFTFSSDQCGSYSGEGDCYNREHSFPKSWFNDATPMYTDLFHLYPTDGYVNGRRSNYPFGEVSSPTWTSQNGSKLGPCSYSGYSGTVFEPIDEYKGDFARSYFYMVTCYHNIVANWNTDMLDGSQFPAFAEWAKNMLLEWSEEDPVSQKEIDRNNTIYNNYQHNRNPFIDHPEYAKQIWGDGSVNVSFTSSAITSAQAGTTYTYNITVSSNPGATFTITASTKPTWLTLTSTGNGTATLSGTPEESNVGSNPVVLNVTDGTSSATQNFTITVASSIIPLQFTSTPVTTGQVGTEYNYNVAVTGNAGATFTITAPTKPDWLTLTSTGNGTATLSGIPTSSGTSNVLLTAGDGTSTTDQSFSINITTATTGSWATETFENMPANASSYSSISWAGDNKINWTATYARTDQTINTRAICLKDITSSLPYVQSQTITGGCTQIRFKHQQKFSGSGGIITLYVNNTEIGTANVSTTEETSSFSLNATGDFVIKLVSNGAARIAIDDLEWIQPESTPNELPNISSVNLVPTNPTIGQSITISANVTDTDGTIQNVILGWGTTEEPTDFSTTMTASGDVYSATIPAQSQIGTLYFKISATDNTGDVSFSHHSITITENQAPTIANISQNPENPTSTSDVVISAIITDAEGRLSSAILYWGLEESNLSNQITMDASSSTCTATIPAQVGDQTVYYKIIAKDAENNETQSNILNYTVENSTGNILPVISTIVVNPASPVTGQAITISANITDADGTVVKVLLNWGTSIDAVDSNLEMTVSENTYSATIPAQNTHGTLYYKIEAIDNSNDTAKYNNSIVIDVNELPTISSIVTSPSSPMFIDNVVISAQVIDVENRLGDVKLYWGLTESSLTNEITMTNTASTFSATIPAQAASQTVYFKITAVDQENNQGQSEILNYSVLSNKAPTISNITVNPTNPTFSDNVTVSANVADPEGHLGDVKLYWGLNEANLTNEISMTNSASMFSATIPTQAANQTVYFRITAVDQESNLNQSEVLNYSVIANEAPTISNITVNPISPTDSDNVTVSANVADPEGHLGDVKLYWGLNEATLANEISMTNSASMFSATIPAQAANQTVYFRIKAIDLENNQSQSNILNYSVIINNEIPIINSISIIPNNPVTGQSIVISANITDNDGNIVKTLLNWGSTSEADENSVEMSASGNTYSTTIPAQSQAKTLYYKISAIDNGEDTAYYSNSIVIAINQLPIINNLSQSPENPTSTDNVNIAVQVSDPEGRLGTVLIQWGYTNTSMNYQVTMTNSSSSAYTGIIPLQTTATTVYYRIKAYDQEGNQAYSNIINYTVSPSSGIDDVSTKSIRMYPNPFNDYLNIKTDNSGTTTVSITNIIGTAISQFNFNEDNYRLNTNNLKSGIYIIKVIHNGKTTVFRAVKR
ncbi:MAG: endonuclease [Bacteroidales bacterium]